MRSVEVLYIEIERKGRENGKEKICGELHNFVNLLSKFPNVACQ